MSYVGPAIIFAMWIVLVSAAIGFWREDRVLASIYGAAAIAGPLVLAALFIFSRHT